MTKEEVRFQVALSCIQGVLEAKHGIIGEIVPSVAVKESLRIANEFVKQWLGEHPKEQKSLKTSSPELCESMDERIIKIIIDCLQHDASLSHQDVDDCITYLEKQKEPEDKGEISDGYHTFNELYYYRMLYNAAFFNLLPKGWVHKSKRHNTGEECFGGGWFIVMANLPTGQISNHYELKDWDLFQIPEKEIADEWDGHTPQEAAERIHKYLLEKQKEQKSVIGLKFRVGDTIYKKGENTILPRTIERIEDGYYIYDNDKGFINIKFQDDYELVEQK